MQKVAGDMIPEEALAELSAKLRDGQVKAAMLTYIDENDNMLVYGDGHSIALLVTNIVFGSLHEHLHHEEDKYEARKETGGLPILDGFIPDDKA